MAALHSLWYVNIQGKLPGVAFPLYDLLGVCYEGFYAKDCSSIELIDLWSRQH